MAKILLVDDDMFILSLLQTSLQRNNFQVVLSRSGTEALQTAYVQRPDLIVLDIHLPDMNGVELCRRLRDMTSAPIIVLSALDQEQTVVEALEAGADDYVIKPHNSAELVARIRALLRIRQNTRLVRSVAILVAGDLCLDLVRKVVTIRGHRVELTSNEYSLLLCLMRTPNEIVTHRQLLTETWGPGYVSRLDYLRLYIRYLRLKIEQDPTQPQIIKTARGAGYYIAT